MALLMLTALLILTGVCLCEPTDCSYWRLWEHLNLTSSNTFVANARPVQSWNRTTSVYIDMILYGILNVDEMSQTVAGATWTIVSWSNEFMVWDPADFCGVTFIAVPRSMVWVPDLLIQEDVSDSGSIKAGPYVNLNWNGWTTAASRELVTFTCQLDLKQFPFDDQNCTLTFTSMISPASVMILTTVTNSTQLTNTTKEVLLTQGEWDLKNICVSHRMSTHGGDAMYSNLVYNVIISRRPMLYIIIFIVPLFYFLILDLASFFINEAGGEKLSFKVTILLSISVLLLILKDMLPSTEKNMPMIEYTVQVLQMILGNKMTERSKNNDSMDHFCNTLITLVAMVSVHLCQFQDQEANYCTGVFALVGISVLEAMAISFLLSFEEKLNDIKQTWSHHEEDILLEKTNSNDPHILTVSGDLSETSPPPLSDQIQIEILKQILHELKKGLEETVYAKIPEKRPRFLKLVMIIDATFFVLYFLTVMVFLVFMFEVWGKHYND